MLAVPLKIVCKEMRVCCLERKVLFFISCCTFYCFKELNTRKRKWETGQLIIIHITYINIQTFKMIWTSSTYVYVIKKKFKYKYWNRSGLLEFFRYDSVQVFLRMCEGCGSKNVYLEKKIKESLNFWICIFKLEIIPTPVL